MSYGSPPKKILELKYSFHVESWLEMTFIPFFISFFFSLCRKWRILNWMERGNGEDEDELPLRSSENGKSVTRIISAASNLLHASNRFFSLDRRGMGGVYPRRASVPDSRKRLDAKVSENNRSYVSL